MDLEVLPAACYQIDDKGRRVGQSRPLVAVRTKIVGPNGTHCSTPTPTTTSRCRPPPDPPHSVQMACVDRPPVYTTPRRVSECMVREVCDAHAAAFEGSQNSKMVA